MVTPVTNQLEHMPAIELLCQQFLLGELRQVHGQMGGTFNVNIKIETTKGLFAVRILNRTITEEHLRYTQKILSILDKKGVPVLLPVCLPNGDSFIRDQEKIMQITPFIDGTPFQRKEKQVFASAQSLKTFHQSLANAEVGPQPVWSFYRTSEYFMNTLELLKKMEYIPTDERLNVEKLSETILTKWEKVESRLPSTIVHGDWHFWNQFYQKNKVCCIMDFDFIQHGRRILDVAYALWVIYVLLPSRFSEFDRLFLSGYGRLTNEEKSVLPTVIAKTGLFFLLQSVYASNPLEKWNKQCKTLVPFIQWVLSDGEKRIAKLFKSLKYPD